MTSPCALAPAPDVCPDLDACHDQILALLPRGRAWETPAGTVRWRFFRAMAALVEFANDRICALREEIFCATHVETAENWLRDYGLPDGCDPFPDVCAKKAAIGGARCDYFASMAARLGWSIACAEWCDAAAGCAEAGCSAPSGEVSGAHLVLRVQLSESPAYGGEFGNGNAAGALEAGQPRMCEPDITALKCLMARIAPAHVAIEYVLVA